MGRRNFPAATTTLHLLLRVVVAAGAITTLTMAAQTVKYAATQAELQIAVLRHNTTVVLKNNILLERPLEQRHFGTSMGAGIIIENVQGLVIDGAGFAIDGQGKMRCLFVGGNSDVALIDTIVTNGYAEIVSRILKRARALGREQNSNKPLPLFLLFLRTTM